MEFMYISSFGVTYRYSIKIEQKLKQITLQFGPGNPHSKSQERDAPTHKTKDRENMDSIKTTSPRHKQIRKLERQRNIPGSGATSIRSLGITLLIVAQRSCWWPK
jgi:hypothetical protein